MSIKKAGVSPAHGFGRGANPGEPHPRPGLHLRLRSVNDLTPRRILRSPFTIPVVTGDELSIEEEALWTDFDTVGAGRFTSPAAGKDAAMLQTFTANGMTLFWDPKWVVMPGQDPGDVIDELQAILRAHAVFDMLLTRKPGASFAEFSGFAILRNLVTGLKKGEADARYLQMDFTSYRRMSSRRRRHGKAANLPTTATLSADDTLRTLAKQYYGKGAEWRLIAKANGIDHWGSEDPLVKMGRYKEGDKIKIPQPPHQAAPKVGAAEDFGGGVSQAVEVGG